MSECEGSIVPKKFADVVCVSTPPFAVYSIVTIRVTQELNGTRNIVCVAIPVKSQPSHRAHSQSITVL